MPHAFLCGHVVIDARVARVAPDSAPAIRSAAGVPAPFAEHERPRRDLRPNRRFVGAEIEDLRARALLRLAHHERFALDDARDLARRIVEVAEDAALGRAHAHARRLQLVLDAVRAEVALLGRARVRIDEQLIVRTRRHAGPAADARVAVEVNDAVAALEERAGRADVHARRFLALVAQHGEEQPLRVGERALLDRLHPAAVDADRNVVLRLAGDRARMTADALAADRSRTRSWARAPDYSADA